MKAVPCGTVKTPAFVSAENAKRAAMKAVPCGTAKLVMCSANTYMTVAPQ